MFAAFAVNAVAWAANVTLSFNASGGTQSTSQFMLGSQALTFDRTTIPSWITGLTLHQNIGGMINNSIGLTPAVGSWNTSGSSSTCTLDVTVAENTGAARSWTMNILNQSNGSVAWSMLVSQSAGSGGGTPATCYTVTFDPNGGNVGESSRSVADGSSIGTLPTPSRSGYSFAGWFTAASGGTKIASSTIVYSDVTYYAHWIVLPYAWTYTGDASTGLIITGVTPQPSGCVKIPAALDGMPVVKIDTNLVPEDPPVATTFVVPDGIRELGGNAFNAQRRNNVKEVYLPPSLVAMSGGWAVSMAKNCTVHWVVGEAPLAMNQFAHANFWGIMDVVALGGVPSGMSKPGLYYMPEVGTGSTSLQAYTYRCKRAHKEEWDAFLAGTEAEFLGYIDDDYEYAEPAVVTFDANGSDDGFVFAKMRGFELGALPVPVREGYVFAGWFTAAEGGECVSASTIVAEDVRYYAHWISDRCEYAGYTWYYTSDGKGLVITNVSPAAEGSLCIPTSLNGVRVHRCMGTILDLSLVSKVVVPDGVNSLWGNVFHCDYDSRRGLDIYLAPSVTNLANGYCFSQGHYTIHWTLAEDALSIDTYAFNAFYGTLEVTALGGVPLGMVKDGLYRYSDDAKITYICKRAYKAEWDAFFAGTTAEFVGYIDDDYSYSDPVSTITFDSNGGMVAEVCRTLPNGDFLGILPSPSKDGYAFVGWWTAAEGGSQISLGTEISGDAVWYAHWLPACSVTFDANGGSIAETMRIVPLNGVVGTLPWPCRPGFQFDGWWTAPSGGAAVAAKTVVTGDVLYYAHWRVSDYEWQFTGDSESGLTITNVSPTLSGYVAVPAMLYGAPVRQLLGESIYLKMITASSIVIPNGLTGIGTKTYSGSQNSQVDFFVPPSCNTLLDAYAFRGITGTVHWIVDKAPLSIHYTAFSGFCGTLDVVALGGRPVWNGKRGIV